MTPIAVDLRPVADLAPYARNARKHSEAAVARLVSIIEDMGWTSPILVDEDGIVAGHKRRLAALAIYGKGGVIRLPSGQELPAGVVPTLDVTGWTEAQRRAYILADNQTTLESEWDGDTLKLELSWLEGAGFDMGLTGFDGDALAKALGVGSGAALGGEPDPLKVRLADRFGVPPFSVLNAREGWWQDRKRAWLALGIRSEIGRGENLLEHPDTTGNIDFYAQKRALEAELGHKVSTQDARQMLKDRGQIADFSKKAAPATSFASQSSLNAIMKKGVAPAGLTFGEVSMDGALTTGTSIFDPVLCELAYRWFSPPGGTVLDPFAGGSVRGIVAAKLGRHYVGCDLRGEQVAANRDQGDRICDDITPVWHVGDSRDIRTHAAGTEADFIFSCPPYADLEVYSDDPADLSTLGYDDFREAYFKIIAETCALLKNDRFACFVVGEVRAKDGSYYGFVPDTIEAFRRAGLSFYNEAILVTAAGSLPIRAGRQFEAGRKLGKTHQNILVFVKGDAKRATQAIGPVEFAPMDEADADADGDATEDDLGGIAGDAPLTPIQQVGDLWVKRDDLFEVGGVRGGKVRSCWRLAQGATGLITAGSRASPQVNIVSHIARELGIPCRVHTPTGDLSPEVQAARDMGAEVIQHKAGYNSVIVARARDDARKTGWREIPFGMECREAVAETAAQVRDIPEGVQRIVMPVGSGMSLSGVLHGLLRSGIDLPVLGVVVGADPEKRLDKWAPSCWREMVRLVRSPHDYHEAMKENRIGGITVDPIYEAKVLPFLEPGDLFWIVGIRQTAAD